MGDAMKWEEVMHAQRLERDVAHEHELVVSLIVGENWFRLNGSGVNSSA